MTHRFVHRITRRARLLSFAPLAWWAWKYRDDLRRALPMLRTAPAKVRAGQAGDVLLEARVRRALAMNAHTRGDDTVEVRSVHHGVAHLVAADGHHPRAASVVAGVSGITRVDLDPAPKLPLPMFA